MATITWIMEDGSKISADVKNGLNLMEAATANNVPHIEGECGGCLSCATCHVFVDPAWFARTGEIDDIEEYVAELEAKGVKLDKTEMADADYQEALADLNEAIELDPDLPAVSFNLARLYIDRGEYDEADALLLELEQGRDPLDPEDSSG